MKPQFHEIQISQNLERMESEEKTVIWYIELFFCPEHYSLSMFQPCIRRNFGVVLLVMRLYAYYIILNFEYINCNFKLYKSLSYAQDVKIFDLIIKLIPVLYCTGNNLFLSIKEMFLTSGACAYHGEIKTFNL